MLRKMQLKNGLDVFFFKSNKAPVVSTRIWVKTGSADEQRGEEGLSHFIEHLVFKGSKKLGVGDAAKKIESSGGQLNAYTSFDETVFHVTQHKDQFEVGLEVISEMMGYPSFVAEEVDREREVVLEEIKRTNDNPGRQASRIMFSTVYGKHPYGIPVIGYPENISKVSNETIRDYFSRRYVPENMFLVISGDFDLTKAKKVVKKYFEPIPAKKVKKVKRVKEPEQKRSRVKVKKTEFKQNLINMSWPIPKISHKDIAAIDLLAMILGQSESSILNQKLRIDKEIVRYAYSSLFATKDNGFFNISLSVDQTNIEKAMDELLEALKYFISNEWDQQLIDISKASLKSDEVYPFETVDGISKKIGYYEFNFNNPEYSAVYLERVSKLNLKDIYRVFKKYLNPNKLSLTMYCESSEKKLESQGKNWVKKYRKFYNSLKAVRIQTKGNTKQLKVLKSLKRSSQPNDIEEVLDCGLRLFIRQSKDVPVVSVRAALLGGVRFEPTEKGGVSELMTQAWGKEISILNEQQQAKYIELRSSSLSSFCGKNTNGMSMTTLTPQFNEMFSLFLENFNSPLFNEKVIEREKLFLIQNLKQQVDNPAQLAVKSFMKNMFSKHPYGQPAMGTIESLKSLSQNDVKSFYTDIFNSDRLCMSVSGDIKNIPKIKDQINKAFEDWKGDQNRLAPITVNKVTQSKSEYLESNKEQTHLLIGYPGLKMTDKKRYALDVLQSVLAGQGGRLFLELRDKHSMAYSLSPMRMDGLDGGFFGAYIACSPEKAKKAIEMLELEFDKLIQQVISEKELNRSKQYIIGRYYIDLQKNSAFTSSILFNDIYGISSTEVFDYKNKIMAVRQDDVKRLAQEIFTQPKVLSAVGQICPW